ncbi:hypothetical protein NUW58_g3101 [Xylaria curta]|uniref:Uncharacterized protein n=1 Tax=Xylaria curta TaxID=42375 RepID=A0ACC1PCJ3_9PEZI|nr:hypothetical protein NUW58_g3101 [Xylaria curta]
MVVILQLFGLANMEMAVVIVATRCIIRFFLIYSQGMDDYLMLGALIFTIAYQATIYVSDIHGGLGMPMATLSHNEMITFLKCTLAIEIFYYVVIFCIKSSIVFMYQRFAVGNTFKKLCVGTNILLAAFHLICVIITLAQCTPLEKSWDITKTLPGSCINLTAFFYFTSGFNIIMDIWILLLPIPTLRSLQISQRNRYVLYGVFGIGALATAMSVVRLYSIHTYTLAADPFKDGALVNVWSMVEVNIGIVCASIPALKPLLSPQHLVEIWRKRRGYSSHITESSHKKSKLSSASRSHIIAVETPNRTESAESLGIDEDASAISLPNRVKVTREFTVTTG